MSKSWPLVGGAGRGRLLTNDRQKINCQAKRFKLFFVYVKRVFLVEFTAVYLARVIDFAMFVFVFYKQKTMRCFGIIIQALNVQQNILKISKTDTKDVTKSLGIDILLVGQYFLSVHLLYLFSDDHVTELTYVYINIYDWILMNLK